jgi:hypothetical protein
MNKNDCVTDVQHARTIIKTVGKCYQYEVIDLLQSLTYYHREDIRKAQKVIDNMESEYALNVANVLWKDKFDEIPQWLRDYGKEVSNHDTSRFKRD